MISSAAFRCSKKLSSFGCPVKDLSRQEPYAFCGCGHRFVSQIFYLSSIFTIENQNFTTLTYILHQPLTFTFSPTHTYLSHPLEESQIICVPILPVEHRLHIRASLNKTPHSPKLTVLHHQTFSLCVLQSSPVISTQQ